MKNSKYVLDKNTSIEVAHQGSHVCSWRCHGREQLYLSPIQIEGKAIRGGIPVIFPQFEEFGDGPRHGFARMANWLPQENECGLSFRLNDTDSSWPYKTPVTIDFKLTGESFSIRLLVKNDDKQVINFTCALHTYFLVNDIKQTSIQGLKGLEYWTNAQDFAIRKKELNDIILFNKKTDRIYFGVTDPIKLIDVDRSLLIEHSGFEDIVVWNPWVDDAQAMADLPDTDYQKMLCVEPARVNNPVTLKPGESWLGIKTITVESR